MTRCKPCYLTFNVNFFFVSLSILQHIHSQSRMIKITFCSLSFRSTLISLILVSFWFILSLFCHSASFRYIPVPFLFIPSHSSVIWFYSRVIAPCSGIFRFILVCSALFACHSASFRCHSGSFRYIPVPFLFIPSHSGVIPPHSGLFRYIPFPSVPFLCLVTPFFYLGYEPL